MTASADSPRRTGERVVAGAFLGLSGLVFEQAFTSLAAQGAASGGAMQNASFYPEILAAVLAILALAQIFKTFLRPKRAALPGEPADKDREQNTPSKQSYVRGLICTAALLGYIFALVPIGYQISTPLFLFVMYRTLGERNLIKVAALSIATSLLVSFVFQNLLDVIFPVGRLAIGF